MVHRAGGEDFLVIARGAQGAARRPFIASRNLDQDTGCVQGLNFIAELVCAAAPIPPRVVDCIGRHCRVRVPCSGSGVTQVPRRQIPLKTFGEGGIAAVAASGHIAAVYRLRARGYTDLVGAAIIADHRAGGVRAVSVSVIRLAGRFARGVPPVVVVIHNGTGRGILTAAIVGRDGRVIVIQPGIIASQHNAGAIIAHCPDIIRIDERDIRLDSQRRRACGRFDRLLKLEFVVGRDLSHIGAGCNIHQEGLISAVHQDLVSDVVRAVFNAALVEFVTQCGLCACCGLSQGVENELAFFFFRLQFIRRAKVRFLDHPDEEIGLSFGFDLC